MTHLLEMANRLTRFPLTKSLGRLTPAITIMYILACTSPAVAVNLEAVHTDGYYIGSAFFTIKEKEFDFGWAEFFAGTPTHKGSLDWHFENGKVNPQLWGYLHLTNVQGLCGRMRMDFYGGNHVLLTTKYGNEKCAKSDAHQSWKIQMSPYQSNKTNEVKVSIEKKTASKDWHVIASDAFKLIPKHQKLKFTDAGIDFGSESFAFGAPTGSGEVTWTLNLGKVVPRLTGFLHINNAASVCARMRITYFAVKNVLLDTKFGGTVCAPDNSHHKWSVNLSTFESTEITYIKVSLQTLSADNTWRRIGRKVLRYTSTPPGYQELHYEDKEPGYPVGGWRKELK